MSKKVGIVATPVDSGVWSSLLVGRGLGQPGNLVNEDTCAGELFAIKAGFHSLCLSLFLADRRLSPKMTRQP